MKRIERGTVTRTIIFFVLAISFVLWKMKKIQKVEKKYLFVNSIKLTVQFLQQADTLFWKFLLNGNLNVSNFNVFPFFPFLFFTSISTIRDVDLKEKKNQELLVVLTKRTNHTLFNLLRSLSKFCYSLAGAMLANTNC